MSRRRAPRALGWVGGKSAHGNHKTGAWIVSLLPPAHATYTFIEPFCGMAGVLLQRPAARREILNDADRDLINWWRAVRDFPVQLGELLDFSPGWSSALFSEAVAYVNRPWDINEFSPEECVRHAYYFTIALHWVRGGMIGRVRQVRHADGNLKRGRTVGDSEGAAMIRAADDDGISRRKATIREMWDTLEERKAEGEVEVEGKEPKGADGAIRRSPQTRREDWEKSAAKRQAEAAGEEPKGADGAIRRAPVSRWEWIATYAGTGKRPADDGVRVEKYDDEGKLLRGDGAVRRRPEGHHEKDLPPFGSGYKYKKPRQQLHKGGEMSPPRSPQIMGLWERVKDIELETRGAEWMLDYYASNPNITWYLDPPYPSAAEKHNLYTFNKMEVEPYLPLLRNIRGVVALSGYGDEWSVLEDEGWLRHEHKTIASAGAQHNKDRTPKVEVLWTNYDPDQFAPQPALFPG